MIHLGQPWSFSLYVACTENSPVVTQFLKNIFAAQAVLKSEPANSTLKFSFYNNIQFFIDVVLTTTLFNVSNSLKFRPTSTKKMCEHTFHSQLLLLCWYLKVIKLKSVLFITIPINLKRQEDGRGNSWISERLKRTVQGEKKKKKKSTERAYKNERLSDNSHQQQK